MPSGGCNRPIIRFSVMIRPKWIGSMPSLRQIGNRIGTRMVIAAVVSMKQPTNRIRTLASARNTHLLWVMLSIQSDSIWAACDTVSNQAKIDAAVTMNSTDAVVSMVSNVAFATVCSVIERYRTNPRNSDQITAATAASVGVNQPSVMPPIRITGAISAITAEKSKYQSSASSTASPIATAILVERPAMTISQTAIGKPSTMTISRPAEPTCLHENGESL